MLAETQCNTRKSNVISFSLVVIIPSSLFFSTHTYTCAPLSPHTHTNTLTGSTWELSELSIIQKSSQTWLPVFCITDRVPRLDSGSCPTRGLLFESLSQVMVYNNIFLWQGSGGCRLIRAICVGWLYFREYFYHCFRCKIHLLFPRSNMQRNTVVAILVMSLF